MEFYERALAIWNKEYGENNILSVNTIHKIGDIHVN